MKLYKAEIEQLRLFDHDNIMRYFDDFEFNEDWYIVMEYCENGDLGRLRMRVNCLNEPVCKNIIVQLLSAIAAMHEKNTAHRDIKPANVLIDGNYDLKLADFGLSRHNN